MTKQSLERVITLKLTPLSVVRIFVVILLGLALWELQSILIIVLTAVVIASFVEAGAVKLQQLKLPRSLAVLIVYTALFALFGLVIFLFLPTFIDELSGLTALLPEGSGLTNLLDGISNGGKANVGSGGVDPVLVAEQLRDVYFAFSSGILEGASSLFGGVVNFVLIIVISFYLSMQEKGISQFLRLITPIEHEEYVIGVWQRTQHKIGLWFQGQMVMALIVFVLSYLGLTILGVPYALMLSLLAGVFELVPFGLLLAAIPALIIAFLAGGWGSVLLVGIVYFAIQQFENYVLQPIIIQRATGVPSLIVLLSIIMGIQLFGFLGLFLGIPFAVVALEILNDYESKKLASFK